MNSNKNVEDSRDVPYPNDIHFRFVHELIQDGLEEFRLQYSVHLTFVYSSAEKRKFASNAENGSKIKHLDLDNNFPTVNFASFSECSNLLVNFFLTFVLGDLVIL